MKLANPGITTEPKGLTASQSRSADILTTAAVTSRSAALDVCVASSIAVQAAFDSKLSYYRNVMGELRLCGAFTVASGRTTALGRHTNASVRSRHTRQKHEIQITLLQQKTTVARAVLPNPSARAEWLFAGIIDRALHH